MRQVNIGNILGLRLPGEVSCENDTSNDCIVLQHSSWKHPLHLHLFQDVEPGSSDWCHQALEEHVRDVIGPPYTTNVQPVTDENWVGYQAVTCLSPSDFLINRVIVSKVSEYAARAEFKASKDGTIEMLVEILEDMQFLPESPVP